MNDIILTSSSFFLKANQKVKVLKRNPELVYPLHGHDFYELVIVESGTGIQFTEMQTIELGPGSMFLIPIGMLHGYKELNNLVLYNIMIKKEFLDLSILQDLTEMPGYKQLFNDKKTLDVYRITPNQVESLTTLVDIIKNENTEHIAFMGSEALSFATTITLLVNIARIIQMVPIEDSSVNQRMKNVFSFLGDNLSRNVSTNELMEIANMSSSTLNRYFKKITGLSPVEYHLHKRMSNACELIHLTGKTMEEISDLIGFADASYFSRQFKRVMKVSPSEYRESWKKWDLDVPKE